MDKISILILLMLQLYTTDIQGITPCSDLYTYTVRSGADDILGQVEVPFPAKSTQYNLRVGFYTIPDIHTIQPVARVEIAPPVEETIRAAQQGRPLLYHIYFPKNQAIPRVTKIWFNDHQLCPGPGDPESVPTTVEVRQSEPSTEPPSQPVTTTKTPLLVPTPNNQSPTSINFAHQIKERYKPQYNNTDQCGLKGYVDQLVKGGETTNPAQWPWLVALFVLRPNLRYQCAGSVLTTKHVITAAHCMKWNDTTNDTIPASVFEVALGRFNLRQWREGGSVNREVSSYTIHPDYAHTITGDSDLAILNLVEPVEFSSFIKPVCLWPGSDTLRNVIDKLGYVVGWGKDEHGNYPDTPRMVKVPIVSQETCLRSHKAFYELTSLRTFCAGARDLRGPCNGDSGSALTIYDDIVNRYQLRGVVSRSLHTDEGNVSCDLQNYVVYVDVAKYKTWIVEQISTT
ncbi:PREDICTED: chymotrypsin-C-like [Vollenhovia emeryi]|uniref:chymotrypsin-C-like n=1 Tax=Vollenhovia emeryi TaxID=411798 RepID=UPI0005F545D9|nr:PREDICTED: chymotrypsin-C-like [Vollenhovia emeryi]